MRAVTVAALLSTIAPLPAAAEPSKEAKAFGAREYIQDISLSTDGTKVAIVRPDGPRGSALTIADLSAGQAPQPILRTSGNPERLTGCRWTTAARLVCTIFIIDTTGAVPLTLSRLIAINADGSGLKMVSERSSQKALGIMQFGGSVIDWTGDGKGGSVLMMRAYVPEQTIGTNLAKTKQGVGVDLVDTTSLSHKIVESPKLFAADYITDGIGDVRVLGTISSGSSGYGGDVMSYSYRMKGDRDWIDLGKFYVDGRFGAGFEPRAVDPQLDVLYGFDDAGGRQGLYRFALDGSKRKELVLARPDVDVDGLVRIGRQQRVVGVSWAAERREVAFFDPELKALSASLAKALPKQPLVRFVDASADEKQLLMYAGSDDDAGRYYLFDKASRKLEEVLPARPQLDAIALGEMKAVSYKAADGTVIPAYLTLPVGGTGRNLPAIVMPHGGPSARDEWGFDWLAQFFAARGYAVLQPNFRGSSGYGEGWFRKNGFQSWRIAVGDVNDGGRWLVAQGIAAPKKLAIVGWSYGGYAALQSAVLDPALFKAIVAVAPVTDLDVLRNEARQYTNFPIIDRYIGSGAHLKEGSPARNAARIEAPVLLFHGDVDRNVGVGESRLMADKLRDAGKKVEYVEFKGLDHQLDDSAARTELLDKSDIFLRATLGL